MATVRRGGQKKLPILLRDTREKVGKGYKFRASASCAGMEIVKLDVGDYTIKGLEDIIMVERKTIGDLWGTLGNHTNWERFLKEMKRAENHPYKFMVIEGGLHDIDRGYSWSKVPANVIHGKLISLQIRHNLHIIFAGREDRARKYVRRLLIKLHDYYQRGILNVASKTAD